MDSRVERSPGHWKWPIRDNQFRCGCEERGGDGEQLDDSLVVSRDSTATTAICLIDFYTQGLQYWISLLYCINIAYAYVRLGDIHNSIDKSSHDLFHPCVQ